MDSVKLPTAPSSLRTQMSPHHFHHLPLPHRSFPLKPVIGITRSRSHHVSPVAVLFREETSLAPLDLPLPRLKVSPNSLQYPSGYLGAVPERASDYDNGSIVEAMEYLTNILSTKVYDIAVESPLHLAKKLSERLGVRMLLKREDLQPWQSVEDLGAKVVLVGDSYDEAQAFAKQRAEEEGLSFIPPFDHPDVIAGQGTVGMEITRQAKGPLHAIFVPIGGGGLIAGIASYVKRVCPEVKIIGVEPADANTMALSLHHGERVILDQVGGFADGVAVKEVGKETFRICQNLVDGVVLVTRDAICASIKDMFEEQRNILEPAGALALAGAEAYCKYYGLKDVNVVAITSGANMNFDKLRIVTELANVGRQQEAVLATLLPEKPGSFKQFCELIGPMNITEFKYRCGSEKESVVLYSVGVHTAGELKALEKRMESSQLRTRNLTTSDLVKDHLRYLMGGRSSVEEEVLCQFTFPERPGALMNFLDSFSPRWNISLFHYRAEGGAGANVLVGIQVSEQEMEEFRNRAQVLGYEYVLVSEDAIFNLLMQ
ncbi:threonine dehydratase biosynthetic, chloroplastic isoform X2 [Brassica rapa]|uniref:threonine dehydratase biosynthetic, chloroplastic isoform X2 n=1 Tax=Brassica campestris TaxID=3711 RepID=UPI0004F1B5AC|nr:threonine dehydratase biosynthetic, chloroplastic isoform X2 [Brassica rapa]